MPLPNHLPATLASTLNLTGHSSPPHHSSIHIQLDSSDLVLRALSGNESSGESASLSGQIQLQLAESSHLKDVSLILRCVAKIDYLDPLTGKRYHHHHSIYTNSTNFLPQTSDPHSNAHTLQAGFHQFPFSIHLPSDLPSSLRTYSGSGTIYYKLKAIATRPGFLTTSKWESKSILRLARSFPIEAIEWNQTLEIQNTWPGS